MCIDRKLYHLKSIYVSRGKNIFMSSYLTFKRLNSNCKAMVIASVFTPV